jgi:ankyrin repeat protein
MIRELGNPNYQGPFGNTLLHGAVVSGNLREVKRLLAAGADPRVGNRDGKTPVQAAKLLGHEKIHDVLLKAAAARSVSPRRQVLRT